MSADTTESERASGGGRDSISSSSNVSMSLAVPPSTSPYPPPPSPPPHSAAARRQLDSPTPGAEDEGSFLMINHQQYLRRSQAHADADSGDWLEEGDYLLDSAVVSQRVARYIMILRLYIQRYCRII